jgi:hypothetical protein
MAMAKRGTDASRLGKFLIPVLVFISPAACASVVDPPLPGGTHRFVPPAVYQTWWSMAQECSGREGTLSSVEFYVVPGVPDFEHHGRMVSGYWSRASNRIVLAEKAVLDGPLVRHEMLHSLEHDVDHRRTPFLEHCGGVVVCITSCLSEAGRARAPGAGLARVPPDSMIIDVQVNPAEPGQRIDEGHFHLTVTVKNPRRDSVVVLLPPSRDAAPPGAFNVVVRSETMGLWYEERAWDSGLTTFGPGETRRAVYDFRTAPRFDGLRALPPGAYSVRGGFGPAKSAQRTFVLQK